ncbi:hypothetical protein [Spirosoma aerophilum]
MSKEKLYSIWPECYNGKAIRNESGQDAYFLTAHSTVFDLSDGSYTDAFAHFVTREMIVEITIVNDPTCRFVTNVISQEERHTSAEHTLKKAEKVALLTANKQKMLLSELNIFRQAYELSDPEFMKSKIKPKKIRLRELIYDQTKSSTEWLNLTL